MREVVLRDVATGNAVPVSEMIFGLGDDIWSTGLFMTLILVSRHRHLVQTLGSVGQSSSSDRSTAYVLF